MHASLSQEVKKFELLDMYDSDLDEFSDFDAELYDDFECPVCESDNIITEGRCKTCLECGWSKCSL